MVRLFLLLGLLTALVPGCSREPTPRRTIIFVVFDTTRQDHLSLFGYFRDTTPALREMIGEQHVRFDQAIAASNNTLCSHASFFTGLHVKSHGVSRLHPTVRPLHERFDTLAEVLRDEGYLTAAAVSAAHLNGEPSGFGQGFETFLDCPRSETSPKRPAEATNRELIPFLEQTYRDGDEDRPLFLWLHYFDPHYVYKPPDRFKERFPVEGKTPSGPFPVPPGFRSQWADRASPLTVEENRALYDAEILRADFALREVFETLEGLGLLDDAFVVFTADHGENLGEHGLYYDHQGLYEEVIRVPLVIRAREIEKARTIDALVHHVDLMPTMLEAAGVPADRWPSMEGTSLVPFLHDADEPVRELVFSEAVQAGEKSVRDTRHKLVIQGTEHRKALFDLEADPDEERDIADEDRETTAAFYARLLEFLGPFEGTVRVTAAETARMITGSIRVPEDRAPIVLEPGDLADAHLELKDPTRAGFRFRLTEGRSKAFRFSAGFGPVILDLYASEEALVLNPLDYAGASASARSLPVLFGPDEPIERARKADTWDPCLVLVESSPADGGRRYRVSVRQAPDRLFLRVGTFGRFEDVRGVDGELAYRELSGGGQNFRVDVRAGEAGAFELTVKPDDALLFLDGRVGKKLLCNTSYRVGDAENPRAYPTAILISPELSMPGLPRNEEEEKRVKTHPGLYVFFPQEEWEMDGVDQGDLLEELGYVEGKSKAVEEKE